MPESARDLYVTGLVNARALETEAIQMLSRQVERIENYPEVADALRRHVSESEQQRDRLDGILGSLGTSHSAAKDIVTGVVGNMAALGHVVMPDEILKNSMANLAFEHFEIASYRSLLILAELAGDAQGPAALRQSLQEEERMARWCADNLEPVVRTYAARSMQGVKAGI